jgi:Flp pilus assembly protein TadB
MTPRIEHDPEKCAAVFRRGPAQLKKAKARSDRALARGVSAKGEAVFSHEKCKAFARRSCPINKAKARSHRAQAAAPIVSLRLAASIVVVMVMMVVVVVVVMPVAVVMVVMVMMMVMVVILRELHPRRVARPLLLIHRPQQRAGIGDGR